MIVLTSQHREPASPGLSVIGAEIDSPRVSIKQIFSRS
jgi:hypothetical protein